MKDSITGDVPLQKFFANEKSKLNSVRESIFFQFLKNVAVTFDALKQKTQVKSLESLTFSLNTNFRLCCF